jgi:hypothetical protein
MATYLDNAGVTQILTKIKSLLAKKAEITAIPTKVSQLTNDSQYQNATEVNTKIGTELGKLDYDFKDEQEGNSFAANWFLSGITQTDGKIKAEKADFDKAWGTAFQTSVSRGGEAITETQVDSKIRAAVDKITSFEYKVVSELPPESDGVKGTIYLLRHGGNDNTNSFDEYILVDTYSSGGITYSAHYEKIGTTDIDLTPYAKKTEIPTAVSDLANDLGFETSENVGSRITSAISVLDYSDTAEEGKYVSSVSETNGVIKVTRASLPAVGTADSPISNATIESIFTQVFG